MDTTNWGNFVKVNKLKKKVYLIKIDIKNAFGSIFHQKLIEVIVHWSSDIVVIRKFA